MLLYKQAPSWAKYTKLFKALDFSFYLLQELKF